MPILRDIQRAVPLCQRKRLMREGAQKWYQPCWQPMDYLPAENAWHCPSCCSAIDGAAVVTLHVLLEAGVAA